MMMGVETDIMIIFSFILLIAFFISELVKTLKITPVPFYIISGIIIGPFGFGLSSNVTIDFIGKIGLLFLVFLAGMEVSEYTTNIKKKPFILAIISIITTFSTGYIIGSAFGYGLATSLLIGSILVSSSIGMIIPMVNSIPQIKKHFGDTIIPGLMLLDVTSLMLLGIIVKLDVGSRQLSIFLAGVFFLIIVLIYIFPHILKFYYNRKTAKPHEADMMFLVALLITVVAFSELIGLHGIVGAFLVGIIYSHYTHDKKLVSKISGIAYGFMIPVFFIAIGMELNIGYFIENLSNLKFPIILLCGLMASKIIGAVIYSVVTGGGVRRGVILGIVLFPQLDATLASTAVAYALGFFDQIILISVVIMALFTSIGTPFILRLIVKNEKVEIDFKDHIVVVGYGKSSTKLINMFFYSGKSIVVVENDPMKVKDLEKRGVPVIFGGGEDEAIMESAGIKNASLAYITIPDEHQLYLCARNVRAINPECYNMVKIHTQELHDKLSSEGLIDTYIWPEKHAALEAISRIVNLTEKEGFF